MYERLERQPVSSASAVSHHIRYKVRHRLIFYNLLLFSLLLSGWLLIRAWTNHGEIYQLNEKLARLAVYLQESRLELEHAKQANEKYIAAERDLEKVLLEKQRSETDKDAVVTSLRAQLEHVKNELLSKTQLQNELGNAEYQLQRSREERDQLSERLLQLEQVKCNASATSRMKSALPDTDAVQQAMRHDAALGRHLLGKMRDNSVMFGLHASNSAKPEDGWNAWPLNNAAAVANHDDVAAAELGKSARLPKNDHRYADLVGAEEINDAAGDMSAGNSEADRRVLVPPPRGVAINGEKPL